MNKVAYIKGFIKQAVGLSDLRRMAKLFRTHTLKPKVNTTLTPAGNAYLTFMGNTAEQAAEAHSNGIPRGVIKLFDNPLTIVPSSGDIQNLTVRGTDGVRSPTLPSTDKQLLEAVIPDYQYGGTHLSPAAKRFYSKKLLNIFEG